MTIRKPENKSVDSLLYDRRYGIELEFNSFDNRDFKTNTLRKEEHPQGAEYLACKILESTNQIVNCCGWHHTHNNNIWVVKPDSSCGLEVCSPVLKTKEDLEVVAKLICDLNIDNRIKSDDRCSFHIHVNVADLSVYQIAVILAYWIKCEAVFLDSVPAKRKVNKYCQQIGLTDIFHHDTEFDPAHIIDSLGKMKYFTANSYHFSHNKRSTLEFRIIENEGCLNPFTILNWTKLILRFVSMAVCTQAPSSYEKGNPWSSFLWLDPIDVFTFLGFRSTSLSTELLEVKNWFLERLLNNAKTNKKGIWSTQGRSKSIEEINILYSESKKQ